MASNLKNVVLPARYNFESTISMSSRGLYIPTPISRENGASNEPQYGVCKLLHCPVRMIKTIFAHLIFFDYLSQSPKEKLVY